MNAGQLKRAKAATAKIKGCFEEGRKRGIGSSSQGSNEGVAKVSVFVLGDRLFAHGKQRRPDERWSAGRAGPRGRWGGGWREKVEKKGKLLRDSSAAYNLPIKYGGPVGEEPSRGRQWRSGPGYIPFDKL
jgi:hypothetical protein